MPISAPQKVPERAPAPSGIEELVEFDMAIGLPHHDDCVAQFDQVFLLHVEQLLTHLLGLFFRWKGDFDEISHDVDSVEVEQWRWRSSGFAAIENAAP